jgi:hypothetical protein
MDVLDDLNQNGNPKQAPSIKTFFHGQTSLENLVVLRLAFFVIPFRTCFPPHFTIDSSP